MTGEKMLAMYNIGIAIMADYHISFNLDCNDTTGNFIVDIPFCNLPQELLDIIQKRAYKNTTAMLNEANHAVSLSNKLTMYNDVSRDNKK